MTETIVEFFTTGINAVLTSVVIVALVSTMTLVGNINSKISMQQTVSNQMQEYNEFSQYDRTHVYPQDVVSAIFAYRGEPQVFVSSSKGDHTWTLGDDSQYNTAEIVDKIDQACVYDAFVEKDGNGAIIKLVFWSCDGPSSDGCKLK